MTTEAQRAARGAAWYDERMPGWADKIDLAKLYIHSACNCIRGQLEGMNPEPIDGMHYPNSYGFTSSGDDPTNIEKAWAEEVRKRRSQPDSGAAPRS